MTKKGIREMFGFKDLSVKAKLIVMLAVLAVGTMTFGVVSYTALETVKVGSKLYDRIDLALNLNADFYPPDASLEPVVFYVYQAVLSKDQHDRDEYLAQLTKARQKYDERRKYWLSAIEDGPIKETLKKIYRTNDPYFEILSNEVLPLVKAGKSDQAADVLRAKLLPIFGAYEHHLDELLPLADQTTSDAKAEAQSAVRNRLTLMMVVLLASLGIGCAIGLLIASQISKSLSEKVNMLGRIAAGDLSQRVEVDSHDELGQLGTVINEMVESLVAIVNEIRGNSRTLSSAAEELTNTSQHLGATSEEASSQANAVSAAAEQVSQNVATVSTATEEMTASIKEIAKNATEAASVAGNAAKLAASTNSTMTKLNDSSAQIGNVIKVITSIAEQTNLLALNATIEAARAGEAGKGFAVVANEVKELAKETAKATEDIGQRVEAIQIDAKGAVSAIDEITAVIGKINDIQNTIASSVEEQTAATNEIARNISETAKGSTEIASNITGVAQAALETQQSATGAQQAAVDLSQLAHRLQDVVDRFSLDTNGASHFAS